MCRGGNEKNTKCDWIHDYFSKYVDSFCTKIHLKVESTFERLCIVLVDKQMPLELVGIEIMSQSETYEKAASQNKSVSQCDECWMITVKYRTINVFEEHME